MQQSVVNRDPRRRFGLLLVGVLGLMVAFAPVASATAETLEIPQASRSPSFDSDAQAYPSSATPPGGGAAASSADDEAPATPTNTPEAQPQMAGIDQYLNQDGPNNGYAAGNVRDPRNNRSSWGGATLIGGLMVGLIALDFAINHHHR